MSKNRIMADSFVLPKRKLRIYRIQQTDKATILCLSRDDAVDILKEIQVEKLQAEQGP